MVTASSLSRMTSYSMDARCEEVQSLVSSFAPGRLVSVVWLGPPDADFLEDDSGWAWGSEGLDAPEPAVVLEVRPEQAFLGGTEGEQRRAVLPFLCLCRGSVRTSTTWLAQALPEEPVAL